ncbi:unnamed protein product [Caenorhabditis nigoni]
MGEVAIVSMAITTTQKVRSSAKELYDPAMDSAPTPIMCQFLHELNLQRHEIQVHSPKPEAIEIPAYKCLERRTEIKEYRFLSIYDSVQAKQLEDQEEVSATECRKALKEKSFNGLELKEITDAGDIIRFLERHTKKFSDGKAADLKQLFNDLAREVKMDWGEVTKETLKLHECEADKELALEELDALVQGNSIITEFASKIRKLGAHAYDDVEVKTRERILAAKLRASVHKDIRNTIPSEVKMDWGEVTKETLKLHECEADKELALQELDALVQGSSTVKSHMVVLGIRSDVSSNNRGLGKTLFSSFLPFDDFVNRRLFWSFPRYPSAWNSGKFFPSYFSEYSSFQVEVFERMSDSPILLDYTESDGEEVLPPPPSTATLPGKAAIPARKAPSSMLPRIPQKKQKQPLEDELDETVKAKNERKKKKEERQKEQEKIIYSHFYYPTTIN